MAVLLQVQDIHKSFGARKILEGVTASFQDYQKIGVIGRNGAGKSTLCKIITGEEEADRGKVIRSKALRLSYLEQHDAFKPEETVGDFLERYTGKEGWECGEMAARFQISYEMLMHPVTDLAGGYRTRVKLAAMLLGDPNFLILDEPTNYLDLSTLILLENFLKSFKGGFLIVSHDREFLKKTCDQTLEIDISGANLFPGAIEEYFEFKEEQLRHKVAYNQNVEKKKEQLQDFIDRFKAKASQATRAKSKMKQLDRLETIEIAHSAANVNIRIPQLEAKAGIALSCEDLSIGYPDHTVAERIRVELDRGEKIAVLGDNGQGKTTFLRTIAGDLNPKGGSFKWSAGLKIAYYAQHVFQTLHEEDTVYTHLQREAPNGVNNQDVLDMAGSFLFKGDDVQKRVSVLSGGERARLVLAGLLLRKSHILLLDEPTNHLDFETVEALGAALKKFTGTVFFISHDRTFVNMIATNIVEVKEGRIIRYPGTYRDYVYHLEVQAGAESIDAPSRKKARKNGGQVPGDRVPRDLAPSGKRREDEEKEGAKRRRLKSEMKKMSAKMSKIERRLEAQTQERDRLLEDIQKNPFHSSTKERNIRLKEVQIRMEEDEETWYKLQKKLEKIKKDLD